MSEQIKINDTVIKISKEDLTLKETEAIVFYAREDLQLGSGYGNAISTRGGPSIKKELDEIGKAGITESVITSAGNLNSKYIIHAIGPAFQEEDTVNKLKKTIANALKASSDKGIKKIGFPIMGIGFYGITPDVSLSTMFDEFVTYVKSNNSIEEIIVCANDNREFKMLEQKFNSIN